MKKSRKKELYFCYGVYVLLFIAVALYAGPMYGGQTIGLGSFSFFQALCDSNLVYPFVVNTGLALYNIYKWVM